MLQYFNDGFVTSMNHNCINGARVIDDGLIHGRADVNPEHCQIIIQQSGTTDAEQKFRLQSLNVGTMRGCGGEVVETLKEGWGMLHTRSKVERCIN